MDGTGSSTDKAMKNWIEDEPDVNAQPFAELICAYLDGIPGSADVLNDALEDAGRSRAAVDGLPEERLAVVLENLLTESLARRISVDFARHVAGYCESPVAQSVIDAKQAQVESLNVGVSVQGSLSDAIEPREVLFQLGWGRQNSARSSAAWSLWGALLIPVRYVAQAAQRANTTELQWQIEHLKQQLASE